MSTDPYMELRQAINLHDEWPTEETRLRVVEQARYLVRAVEQKAAMIAQMRQAVTPTDEAIAQLLGRYRLRGFVA